MTKLGAIIRLAGQRLLSSLPALLGVVIFTFVLMRVLPGDPAIFFSSGPSAGQKEIDDLRHQMGLDRSIPVQLAFYLRDIGTGTLGRSMTTGQAVTKDLGERLPASLELTFAALGLALALAIPMGVLAALNPNTVIDHAVRFFCTLGVCVPTFVSGLLLIYVFYFLAGWAPDPTGRIDVFATAPPTRTGFLVIDSLLAGDIEAAQAAARQLILPAATMALFVLAPLARMTRASMLAVLGSDFIRTARAMGLSRPRIIVVYALRNAALPVLTIAGIVFSTMLGANVLVEKVFSWPGVAAYALDALLASDYAPVQGFVLLMASVFVVVNLLVDVLYGLADPRVTQ
jgi:peptide/nickel transport system permease protein